MSEIEQNSGLLDDITTTTATVAAVISSALETAAATDEDSIQQHEQDSPFSHNNNIIVSGRRANSRGPQEVEKSSSPNNNNNNSKIFSLSGHVDHHHRKEGVDTDYLGRGKRSSRESLVTPNDQIFDDEDIERKFRSGSRPFSHHHHPVERGELSGIPVGGVVPEGRSTNKDCDHHSSKSGTADGNHEIHEISSSLSPFLSMAEKAGDYYRVSSKSNSGGRLIRDKSDNRETYQVSHCEEKSTDEYECSQDKTIKTKTTDTHNQNQSSLQHEQQQLQQQTDDSYQSSRVFKPSSKIIELPEKSPRLLHDHSHHHGHHHHHLLHHHHHHYRSKESKIPVGIAVAWQRLVTSTSTNPTSASAMTTKAESGSSSLPPSSSSSSASPPSSSPRHKGLVMNNSNAATQNKQQQNTVVEQTTSSLTVKHPSRPSSASPLSSKTTKSSSRHNHNHSSSSSSNNPIYASRNNNSSGDPNKNGYVPPASPAHGESSDISSVGSNNNNIVGRPLSACGEASGGGGIVPFCPSAASPLSRPLPSSSVPPNLGFPTASSYQYQQHRGSYVDYPYGMGSGGGASSGGFAMPSSPHHHHLHHQQQQQLHHHHSALVGNGHYWGLENPSVPLLSPGMPSPGASEYLQLSMQQQMQLHQQHLLATTRQSSLPISSSSPYNPYLPFLYPHQDASLATKSPSYYDHFLHQNELIRQHQIQHHHHQHQQNQILISQQQQQHEAAFQHHHHHQQQQQLQHQISQQQNESGNVPTNVNSSSNNNGSTGRTSSNTNSNISVSNVGGFDLSANNNGSQNHHHRAIPMQVASSRTSIPSPTGGIRTCTPTSTSSSSSSSSSTSSIAAGAATTTANTTIVTSCNSSSSNPSTTTPLQLQHQDHHQSASAPWPAAGSVSQSSTTGVVEQNNSSATSYSSASSPSPSFLLLHHQQQHPHLFTSSSAALSPKSLTSSTPSPVTVHDFNSGLNVVIGNGSSSGSSGNNNSNNLLSSASTMLTTASRKCATPSPISLTPRGLLSPFGSPFSPSPVPTHPANNNNNNNNNSNTSGNYKDLVWKDDEAKIKPIPTKAHAGIGGDELRNMILLNGHSATSSEKCGNGRGSLTTTPTSSPSLKRKQMSVPTPLSSPSQKHDFKRLESLIERRDSESISPLVLIPQHSPASTTSSIGDKALTIDEMSGHHHHDHHTSISACSSNHPDAGESLSHDDDDDDGDEDDVDLHAERKIIPAFHVKIEKELEEIEESSSALKATPSNTMRLDLHIPRVSGIGGGGSSAPDSSSSTTTLSATSAFELLKSHVKITSSSSTAVAKKVEESRSSIDDKNRQSCTEDMFKVKSNHPTESLHEMKPLLLAVEVKPEKAAGGESPGEILVKGESSVNQNQSISSCDVKFHSRGGEDEKSSVLGEQEVDDDDHDTAGKKQHGGGGTGNTDPDAAVVIPSSAGDDNEIEKNNVPESTLPFNYSRNSSTENRTSFKDKKSSSNEENNTIIQHTNPVQQSRVKDVSFTSGYSSAHDTSLSEEVGVEVDPFEPLASNQNQVTSKAGKEKKRKSQATKDKAITPKKSKAPSLVVNYKKNKPKPDKKAEKKATKRPDSNKTTSEFGMKKEKKSKPAKVVDKELRKIKSPKNKLKVKVGEKLSKSSFDDKTLTVWKGGGGGETDKRKRKKDKDKQSSLALFELEKVFGNVERLGGNPIKKRKEKIQIVSKSKDKSLDKTSTSRKKKVLSDKTVKIDGDDDIKKKIRKERKVKVNKDDGDKSKKPSSSSKKSCAPSSYHRKSLDNPIVNRQNSVEEPMRRLSLTSSMTSQQWPINLNHSSSNNNPVTNNSSPQFIQTATVVTSKHGASSGDINTSFSCSNPQQGTTMHYQNQTIQQTDGGGDQNQTSSLISTTTNPCNMITQQQQPVALILHPNQLVPPHPSSVSCQSSQVTFLIASPTTLSTTGSPISHDNTLRIPAYIPRASTQSTNFSLADDLGGESYGGPATLTLHRDVDSIQQHQSYIQQPPAITIQYHHSAPATPAGALVEAMSPSYGGIKPEENHLNLLATVAQEFGSREDLGKRLSIDGSCNNSIIGESPPMSPQKSPYSIVQYHHPHPINTTTTSMISPCSNAAAAASSNNNAGVKLDNNWASVGVADGGGSEHYAIINNNSSGLSVKDGSGGINDGPLQKLQITTKPEKPLARQPKVEKPPKKPKVEKTANSITKPKAGKKQKRSVSDSASYSPPVVLLKIPQIATKQRISSIQEEKARKQSKQQTKAANNTKPTTSKTTTVIDNNGKSRDKAKPADAAVVVVKVEKKKNSKKDKELMLSKPLSKGNDEKLKMKSGGKPEKKGKTTTPKNKLDKGIPSAASKSSCLGGRKPLLSPLKLKMPGTTTNSTDHITLTGTGAVAVVPVTTTTAALISSTNPVKEKVSKSPGASTCFYNPPERISAFAKQAIARRDSTSTSPTKQPLCSGGSSSSSSNESPFKNSLFFPNINAKIITTPTPTPITIQSGNNLITELESQSHLKMPQLSPYDIPPKEQPITTTPSHQTSLSVPKVVDKVQMQLPVVPIAFPLSSSSSASESLKGLERESTAPVFEQDKKKTDILLDRSPTSSYGNTTTITTTIPSSTSSGKHNNGQVKKEKKMTPKKAKNPPKPLKLSLVKVSGSNDDNQLRKGKKRKPRNLSAGAEPDDVIPTKKQKKKKVERSSSFPSTTGGGGQLVDVENPPPLPPAITITPSSETPPSTATVTAAMAAASTCQFSLTTSGSIIGVTGSITRQFSPLTPPLTAKSEDEREKHSFPSSVASCSASSTTGSSRHSSPSNELENEGEAETENENENDFNNWVADPMFAVSAIKITGSNQPSDNSSNNGGDDSSVNLDVESVGDDERRTQKGKKRRRSSSSKNNNKPPKLTLMSSVVSQENQNMVMSNTHPSEQPQNQRFLEVNKSQLKSSFVHFKPKQVVSSGSSGKSQGNNRHHHIKIKPSLKAEPVVRSQSEEEEDDVDDVDEEDDEERAAENDDDFELDMEVANITTQNTPATPKPKPRKASSGNGTASATLCNSSAKGDGGSGAGDGGRGSSSEAATSSASAAAGKKPSINRNSSSYLSNSSSKQHSHPSTKEIMTKVFSRKVSPELRRERDSLTGAGGKKQRHHSSKKLSKSASSTTLYSQQHGTEMDADDEDEEELLDVGHSHPLVPMKQASTAVSMSALAAAVIVNNNAATKISEPPNLNPIASTSASAAASSSSSSMLLLSSAATIIASPSKKSSSPKKRSARSSTTSSSASVSISAENKVHSGSSRSSSSRGNRGQLSFSGASTSTSNQSETAASSSQQKQDETLCPGKVELSSVEELIDEMRILTEIQGLFYTGRLNALQPPDVYGVTLDNERGAPPHLIFSAEEVLEKCLREKKPQTLSSGLRICAYWSPQYSGLYPGRVSSDFTPKFDPEKDLIPIEFDDGDTGMIKLKEIRLLSTNHPVREYDPNPLLTLEKKHRKRRHSSATGTSGGCTGDHDEPDCGEPYCAKVGKMEEEEEDEEDEDGGGLPTAHHSSSKMLYWTWSGLGYKRPKCKKSRNKEFFQGIQRGNEAINVGDAALFISTGNERPFIGRVERFWEQKGKKMVNVRWFYHPEEVKASAKRLSNFKYPGALFESPHIDENDVQTIAKKCDVLPFAEFKKRLSPTSAGGSPRLAKLTAKKATKPRDMYYVAGYYDPYTYNLTLKDLK